MKYISLAVAAIIVLFPFGTFAQEEDHALDVEINASTSLEQDVHEDGEADEHADSHASTSVEEGMHGNSEHGHSQGHANMNHGAKDKTASSGTSTASSTHGRLTAEAHRSAVANFVQSLLEVSDSTRGGIGAQVREIAMEQNKAASTTVEAMEQIERRSSIKTFFLGSDYKNLGVIRSQLANSEQRIDNLKDLVDRAATDEEKATLETQIEAMNEENADLHSYVEDHADTFSLFGWFVKLIS